MNVSTLFKHSRSAWISSNATSSERRSSRSSKFDPPGLGVAARVETAVEWPEGVRDFIDVPFVDLVRVDMDGMSSVVVDCEERDAAVLIS